MTNFEILTQRPFILEQFLEMIVDDALEAAAGGPAGETSRGTLYKIGEAPGLLGAH